MKSLLSEAVSHSSLAWSEEFWFDRSGDLLPAATTLVVPVSGRTVSVTGSSGGLGAAATGAGVVTAALSGRGTGVPGALDSVGETDAGAGSTNASAAAGVAASPAMTAASRSLRRLKRGGLSCLGGLAGLGLRGLSLALWPPSLNFLLSYLGKRCSAAMLSKRDNSASSGRKVSMGLEGPGRLSRAPARRSGADLGAPRSLPSQMLIF